MKFFAVIVMVAVLAGCSDNRPGRYAPVDGQGRPAVVDTQTGQILVWFETTGDGTRALGQPIAPLGAWVIIAHRVTR